MRAPRGQARRLVSVVGVGGEAIDPSRIDAGGLLQEFTPALQPVQVLAAAEAVGGTSAGRGGSAAFTGASHLAGLPALTLLLAMLRGTLSLPSDIRVEKELPFNKLASGVK